MTMVAACGSNVTSPSPANLGTMLSFVSPPGEEIGRGQTRQFTPDNARVAATTSSSRDALSIEIQELSGVRWRLALAATPGTPLTSASYAVNESESPFFRTGPYLSFSGNGLGCNPVGRFTVRRVTFGGPNMLSALDATFEQRCPGTSQGLTGEVHITDSGFGGGPPPDISGAWSGVFEWERGFDRFQMTLSQTGSTATGTWTAGSLGWNGTIEGRFAFGAFSGSMSFDGVFPPTGLRCQGSAPMFGFIDGVQPPIFQAGPFTGSCQYMPVSTVWRLQTRQ